MKLTPNENVLRVALIIFSILFGILSVSMIALGAVYVDELWWPRKYVALDFLELPTLLMILGCLSLLMSFSGCYCAKSTSRRLLRVFGVILSLILCIELAIAVIAFINFDKHDVKTSRTRQIMFEQLHEGSLNTNSSFERLEEHYKCCGIKGTEKNCTKNKRRPGCAIAVDQQIRIVCMETGYLGVILAILQVMEITYVILIHHHLMRSNRNAKKAEE